jgi:hypothetical protein
MRPCEYKSRDREENENYLPLPIQALICVWLDLIITNLEFLSLLRHLLPCCNEVVHNTRSLNFNFSVLRSDNFRRSEKVPLSSPTIVQHKLLHLWWNVSWDDYRTRKKPGFFGLNHIYFMSTNKTFFSKNCSNQWWKPENPAQNYAELFTKTQIKHCKSNPKQK